MPELRILSGGAAQGLCAALAPRFFAQTGFTIGGAFGAVGAMEARLRAGDGADLVILTRRIVDALAAEGLVDAGSVADVGLVQTGVAVRRDDPQPDVSTAQALAAALREADEIYLPDPVQATAGVHFARVIDALGLAGQVEGRLRAYPNGAQAMQALGETKAARAIGCTQATEILATPGVRLVGLLPPGHTLATMYTAAVCAKSAHAAAARALIALLSGADAAEQRRVAGFENDGA